MKSPDHTISGAFVEVEEGDGEYILLLMRGETVVGHFSTVSPAVAAAASALLDLADDPEALGSLWRAVGASVGRTSDIVSLDVLEALGEAIVAEAEERSRAIP